MRVFCGYCQFAFHLVVQNNPPQITLQCPCCGSSHVQDDHTYRSNEDTENADTESES